MNTGTATSELLTWDADNECSHGWLPHEPCKSCGRIGSKQPYPGVRAVAESERQAVRVDVARAVAFSALREPAMVMGKYGGWVSQEKPAKRKIDKATQKRAALIGTNAPRMPSLVVPYNLRNVA
jgi:hypothetical protein